MAFGPKAPAITGKDVQTGGAFNLSDHAGKVVVVAFNGLSWCLPCQFEAPILQKLWENMKPTAQFVMVSVGQTLQAFQGALQTYGITMPALHDGAINNAYAITAVPTLYLLNRDLEVFETHIGVPPQISADALEAKIRSDIFRTQAYPTLDEVRNSGWTILEIARKLKKAIEWD